MTALPGVSFPPSIVGTTGGTSAPRGPRHDNQLPGVDHRHHGRHVSTTGTAARCQVDDRLAELPGVSLPAVDRRHHGDRGTITSFPASASRRRSSAPRAARCQVDNQLARTRHTCRRRSSAPRGPRHVARSITSLPELGTLPAVDRHHGRHVGTTGGTMTGLPAVNFPPSIIGTTGTAARCQVDDRGTMTSLPSVDHRHGDRGKALALVR